ncbi:MAG: aspartate aminotransferase family protein [Acidobacteria bacterium]|nr:aspartate aminotransferase family protein [Acidobacteriota bacterium]
MSLPTNPKPELPIVQTNIPGQNSYEHWKLEQEHIGPGLQAVVQWAQLCFVKGEGAYLTDADGNVFIDLMGGSGVNSIGHSHPRFVKALSEQLASLVIGGFASQARLDMLETIKGILPSGLDRIQVYSGGTEAVEAALRLAKSYTKKFEFLGFWNAFHGKTMGSLALTDGAKQGLGPMAPGFYTAPYAYCYRCPFGLEPSSCGLACVEHTREVIKHETSGTLAAIVVEPVQGRAGNIPPPIGYLKALQSVAREFDALLIADETMTCFGRTGEVFACDHEGIVPDIMIVGKGMGGGFPVTGIISNSTIMSASPYADASASSSSFGGFPLACLAVDCVLNVMLEEDLVRRSASVGAEVLDILKESEKDVSIVGEVRGRGLMIGIELVTDKESKRPISKEMLRHVYLALLKKGVLVMVGGNSLRLYPPLSISSEIAKQAASIIADVLWEEDKAFSNGTD